MRSSRSYYKKSNSWQTIYMDLMTMVMVFFIILWSLNKGKDEGVSETVGDEMGRMINLPGDVLFASGKTRLKKEGSQVLKKLFSKSDTNPGISFVTDGLTKRMLVIHGHTDDGGKKHKNISLGFQRAYSAYTEISKYSKNLPDHVIICSHADNSPAQDVPKFKGKLSKSQWQLLREARKKNRRITIEDKYFNKFGEE